MAIVQIRICITMICLHWSQNKLPFFQEIFFLPVIVEFGKSGKVVIIVKQQRRLRKNWSSYELLMNYPRSWTWRQETVKMVKLTIVQIQKKRPAPLGLSSEWTGRDGNWSLYAEELRVFVDEPVKTPKSKKKSSPGLKEENPTPFPDLSQ